MEYIESPEKDETQSSVDDTIEQDVIAVQWQSAFLSLPGGERRTDMPYETMLALTQTCRLLRHDYRSHMLRTQRIHVYFYFLPAYLDAFYPAAAPEVMRKYRGDVEINGLDHYSDPRFDFEMLPLITRLVQCPNINISFHCSRCDGLWNQTHNMNKLFQTF
ncbi:hypothetical protein NX059_005552 [Plenodomus lindquistii]|nr:hypothetical protein NX059_005552 [Plenodomus lindquistii]